MNPERCHFSITRWQLIHFKFSTIVQLCGCCCCCCFDFWGLDVVGIYHIHGVDGGVIPGGGDAAIIGRSSVAHADKGGHRARRLDVDDQIAVAHSRSAGRRHPPRLFPVFAFLRPFLGSHRRPQFG